MTSKGKKQPRPRGVLVPGLVRMREHKALTQAELAEAAEVARTTVQRAEHGLRVSKPNARAIARALGVPVETLIDAEAKALPAA